MTGRIQPIQRRTRRQARGFTLLEIMLVVGLLALLAAFVIPNLTRRGEQAKIDLTRAAIGPNGVISNEIRQYQIDVGKYPETLKELSEKPTDEELAKQWKGPYIENPDNMKDAWNHEYGYKSGDAATHNEKKFDLWSSGPDGIEGNEDDIVNWKKD